MNSGCAAFINNASVWHMRYCMKVMTSQTEVDRGCLALQLAWRGIRRSKCLTLIFLEGWCIVALRSGPLYSSVKCSGDTIITSLIWFWQKLDIILYTDKHYGNMSISHMNVNREKVWKQAGANHNIQFHNESSFKNPLRLTSLYLSKLFNIKQRYFHLAWWGRCNKDGNAKSNIWNAETAQ